MRTSSFQIRFLSIAEDDFSEIIMYIAADNPDAAEELANSIEKALNSLSKNPELGRIPRDNEIRELGYRYLIVQNYLIFYTMEAGTIFIHRILHSARNYKPLL